MIVYAILSWVQADSPMADVIDRLCAPLLRPFRRVIPLVGGIDLSPLALLVLLQVLSIAARAGAAAAAAAALSAQLDRVGRLALQHGQRVRDASCAVRGGRR